MSRLPRAWAHEDSNRIEIISSVVKQLLATAASMRGTEDRGKRYSIPLYEQEETPRVQCPKDATHWNSMHKQWRRIDGNQMYGWVEEWRHFGQVRELEDHLVPIENLPEAPTTSHVSKGWTHFEDD